MITILPVIDCEDEDGDDSTSTTSWPSLLVSSAHKPLFVTETFKSREKTIICVNILKLYK